MKTGILFILICLGAARVTAQATHLDIKVADTVANDLFGPVKSTRTVYKKERLLSTSTKHSTLEYERTYDAKGNLLTRIDTDHDDKTTNTTVYVYDQNGCLFEKTVNDSKSETNTTYRYMIDVEALQILRRNLNTGELCITAYNPDGYEYYTEILSASNTVTKTTKIHRQPDNKEYEFATVDGDSNPTETSLFKWNSNELMRERIYQHHGTNEYSFINKYTHPEKDKAGNWTKRVTKTERIHDSEKKAYSEEIEIREIEYFEE